MACTLTIVTGRWTMRRVVLLIGVLVLIAFYLLELIVVRPFGSYNVTYYDELADAFLAGQTFLLRSPPPEMLALPDPWDGHVNEAFREVPEKPGERFQGLHDLTLYHGRLYVEWGALPAVALIPLRWLAGGDLPMGRLVLVVEALAGLTFALAAWRLAGLAGAAPSRLFCLATAPLFMFCPVWIHLLRRIAVYETAVFFAQLWMGLALLSVVIAFDLRIHRGRGGTVWLALASLCLGCAVNCRPDAMPLGLMVPMLWWLWWRCAPQGHWRHMIAPSAAIGLPALLLLFCVFAYNRLRFGDMFEVGQTWQLWAGKGAAWRQQFHFVEPARFLPNIWYFFLAPLEASPHGGGLLRPVLLSPHSWMGPTLLARYDDYIGRTSGLFVIMPSTLLALGSPALFMKRFNADARARAIVPAVLAGGFLAGILPFLAPALLRYCAEWCLWWPVAATIMAALIRRNLRETGSRARAMLFDAFLVVSSAWTSWIGISFLLG